MNRCKIYSTKNLIIDRNTSTVDAYIAVEGYLENRNNYYERITNLPKKLNFTDEQIIKIVNIINHSRQKGFEEGLQAKTNDIRSVLGFEELEEQ